MSFKFKKREQDFSKETKNYVTGTSNTSINILEEIHKIWLEIRNMREDFNREVLKIWEEIRSLREETRDMREEVSKIWGEIRKIWDEIKSLREEVSKIWSEIEKVWKEIRVLREESNKIWSEISKIWVEIRSIRRTVETITITIEDEAREVVEYKLRERFGLDIKLSELVYEEFEVNIFGVSGEYCVIGEATTRAGSSVVEELERKINRLLLIKPELRNKKIIKVIYSFKPTEEAIKIAKDKKIWLLKVDREYTPLILE